jgi:hypothetical protein
MNFIKFSLILSFAGSVAMASVAELEERRFKTEVQEVEDATRKNDLADRMLAQSTLPDGFAVDFLAMLDDPAQGLIWHNYILQKLDVLYLHSDAADQRQQILGRLWQECRSPKPTIAGTTQMTLLRLHEQRPNVVDARKLASRSQWVIEREVYSNSDRLSALHVLSALDYSKSAQFARAWLTDDTSPILLKTTALAILGKQFQESDRPLIEPYLNHPDLRLRTAARSALRQEDAVSGIK